MSIDHTALIQGSGDAKRNIDSLMNMCNIAKRTFPNIFFLIVSQLNREIEGRRDPKDHMPRQSDFYQSDSLGAVMYGHGSVEYPKEIWILLIHAISARDGILIWNVLKM